MGAGVYFNQKGDFDATFKFFNRAKNKTIEQVLTKYAEEGLNALIEATPVDSGITRRCWSYQIRKISPGKWTITYNNSNVVNGFSVVIGLQYGHATRNGGWVEGVDFINPAIQPIFNNIAEAAWVELTSK